MESSRVMRTRPQEAFPPDSYSPIGQGAPLNPRPPRPKPLLSLTLDSTHPRPGEVHTIRHSWSDESPPAFRSDDSPPVPFVKTVGTITQRQFATDRSKSNMKTYQISEDRVVVVKKNLVTIKQKDSDKSFEFTPSRLVLCTFVTKILY